MRTTRFNCSETLLCNIAGVPFEAMTPEQRNHVRILTMYFSTPETYHANVIDEVREFASDISLVVGDAQVEKGVTYYPITASGVTAPTIVKPTVDEMAEKLASRLSLPIDIVKTWNEVHIEAAFVNLGMMPRPRTDIKITGYLLVDADAEYPRFKASTATPDYVVSLYNDYVEQQKSKIADPNVVAANTVS